MKIYTTPNFIVDILQFSNQYAISCTNSTEKNHKIVNGIQFSKFIFEIATFLFFDIFF